MAKLTTRAFYQNNFKDILKKYTGGSKTGYTLCSWLGPMLHEYRAGARSDNHYKAHETCASIGSLKTTEIYAHVAVSSF